MGRYPPGVCPPGKVKRVRVTTKGGVKVPVPVKGPGGVKGVVNPPKGVGAREKGGGPPGSKRVVPRLKAQGSRGRAKRGAVFRDNRWLPKPGPVV